MKITFKTKRPVGRWKYFDHENHYIKLDGIEVGSIDYKPPYYIMLRVIKKESSKSINSSCKWKWIILKKESKNIEEAKQYLKDNLKSISKKWKITAGKS
jgi:hypothetical protein